MVNQLTTGRPAQDSGEESDQSEARHLVLWFMAIQWDIHGDTMEIQKKQCGMVDNVYIYVYIYIFIGACVYIYISLLCVYILYYWNRNNDNNDVTTEHRRDVTLFFFRVQALTATQR